MERKIVLRQDIIEALGKVGVQWQKCSEDGRVHSEVTIRLARFLHMGRMPGT